jgi:glycerophosphoryl diester phosphodiesterase
VRDHVPLEKFVIQAHRGAGVLAPENTVAAFELGWKLNCVPEADVRTTKDGVIVAFHDNNFARVVVGVTPEMAKERGSRTSRSTSCRSSTWARAARAEDVGNLLH